MHILKEGQTHENWKWGLISEFSIVLDEIDSGARDGRSVMEIIGARDALKESQCLLLDEFMDGFLFSLFKQKWKRFARKIFVIHLLLDATYLAAIVGLVINRTVLREWEEEFRGQQVSVQLVWVMLAMVAVLIAEEMRCLLYTSPSPRD